MNNKTKAITESAMMIGISVVIAVLANLGLMFLYVFLPFPLIILSIRRGSKYSIIACVASAIIISFYGPANAVFYLMFGPMSVVMGYFMEKKKSSFYTILWGAVVMMISLIIMVYVSQFITGVTIYDELEALFSESFQLTSQLTSSADMSADMVEKMNTTFDLFKKNALMLIPFSIILFGVLEAYVTYLLMYVIGRKYKMKINPIHDITRFLLPRSFVLGFFSMYLATYFMMSLGYLNGEALMLNIGAIGQLALLVQGLGLVKWFMIRKKISTWFMLLVIVLLPLLGQIIVLLAFADFIFDFRHLRIKA